MAGFEVTLYGRIWVTAEGKINESYAFVKTDSELIVDSEYGFALRNP